MGRKINQSLVDDLMQGELNKSSKTKSLSSINAITTSELSSIQVTNVDIDDLYAAPFNDEFNNYSPLNNDKQFELNKSIVDNGLINPIVLWKIDKDQISSFYNESDQCPYNFTGEKYMILSGHSRANAYMQLREEESEFNKIPSIIKIGLNVDEVKYIIKVSNYCTRELSPQEKRKSIAFMYRALVNVNTKGTKIANKIAQDTGVSLRSVQYQLRINDKLIPQLVELHDNGKLSVKSATKLCNFSKPIQTYIIEQYTDEINNKTVAKLPDSCDRKELVDKVFNSKKELEEMVNITIEIPKSLESKFRDMARKWIHKAKN